MVLKQAARYREPAGAVHQTFTADLAIDGTKPRPPNVLTADPAHATAPHSPLEDTLADRSLRGMSIGSKSMETDEGVDFAPRFQAHYDCPNGHTIILPFSTEAEVPVEWECRCGELALLRDADRPEPKATKPVRTHWDMLLERRTIKELEELLDERLDLLRAGKLRRSA